RLGGLAIYLTLVVTFLLAGVGLDLLLGRGTRIAALIVAASTVLILGLIDDRLPLTPSFKLVVEVLAASVAVLAGYRIRSVVGIDVGILAYVVTIIWVVAVTNAISLVDTLDGLATGISVIVSTTLFSIAVLYNQFELALLLAGLIGALLGFLRYN